MPGPRSQHLRFLTLGPAGSNHDLVTRRYLTFQRLSDASLTFINDFFAGLEMMHTGAADFMVQVAVHPDCTDVVAAAHFKYNIHVIDTFISPSKALAILTRAEIKTPTVLALHPATKNYADLSQWQALIPATSTSSIAEGLLDGTYESGITALELVDRHPGRFRVDKVIGTVDDPWLVFGKQRVSDGGIVAWPDSPAARAYAGHGEQVHELPRSGPQSSIDDPGSS